MSLRYTFEFPTFKDNKAKALANTSQYVVVPLLLPSVSIKWKRHSAEFTGTKVVINSINEKFFCDFFLIKLFFLPPTLDIVCDVGHLVAVEGGTADALALLREVVVQQSEDVLTQDSNGYQIAGGLQPHAQVADGPHGLQAGLCAKDDEHAAGEQTVA